MFRLYSDNGGWEKIGVFPTEGDVVSTIIGYNNMFNLCRFLIIHHDEANDCDIPYKSINNEEKLKEYLLDCKERQIEFSSKKKKKKQKN